MSRFSIVSPLLYIAILCSGISLSAQDESGTASDEQLGSSKFITEDGVDLDALLSNPIPAKPEYKYLYDRRRWLAGRTDDLANFELIAEEFAQKGAFFSAVELFWFAEKMTTDEEKIAFYHTKIGQWLELAGVSDSAVDEGEQYFAAGKSREAMERFYAALEANPYAERAYYQIADKQFKIYLRQAVQNEALLPLDVRLKLFRVLYEELLFAIAIDPILYDAYYLLGNIREILPDNNEFLSRTQILTDKALTFRNEVIPPLEKIEEGRRDPELFHLLGEGLESVGVLDYAVFAYQTALINGSKNPETKRRMNELIAKYFNN